MRDQLPSDLSTGMKRSVAIARALAAETECILYDEPTTMVDPLMAKLLGEPDQKLKQQLKLTSVVVTHDMQLAQNWATASSFCTMRASSFSARRPRCGNPRSRSSASSCLLDDYNLGSFTLRPRRPVRFAAAIHRGNSSAHPVRIRSLP